MHPILERAAVAAGVALKWRGDETLLDCPRRVLLVSRGEHNPAPDTPWLAGAVAASRRAVRDGEVLVAGPGRVAWDAALFACEQERGRAICVVLQQDAAQFVPDDALVIWPDVVSKRADAPLLRDTLLALLADRAYAIHVRDGGHMARLRDEMLARGCAVVDWAADRSLTVAARKIHSAPLPIQNPKSKIQNWQYLTHFTRAPDGPWPGECYDEYLAWLCAGIPYVPRDAFGALRRILDERRVRACGRLMPAHAPMVCFTARRPEEILSLRRWRQGLRRWSFEPYGLAIPRAELARLGARPVQYAEREALDGAQSDERRFMQLAQDAEEGEWRVAGDCELTKLDAASWRVIVARDDEAEQIRQRYGLIAEAICAAR